MANKEAGVYEIPIILKVEGSGTELLPMQSTGENSGDAEPKKNNEKAVSGAKSAANAAKAIATHLVGKTVSTALSNYGNLTGDYTAQQNIQATVSMATQVASAVALGPVGVVTFAIDKGIEVYNYHAQLKRSEAQAAFKQQRVYAEDNIG